MANADTLSMPAGEIGRALRRYHWRVVQADGRSILMNELYPEIAPADHGIVTTDA